MYSEWDKNRKGGIKLKYYFIPGFVNSARLDILKKLKESETANELQKIIENCFKDKLKEISTDSIGFDDIKVILPFGFPLCAEDVDFPATGPIFRVILNSENLTSQLIELINEFSFQIFKNINENKASLGFATRISVKGAPRSIDKNARDQHYLNSDIIIGLLGKIDSIQADIMDQCILYICKGIECDLEKKKITNVNGIGYSENDSEKLESLITCLSQPNQNFSNVKREVGESQTNVDKKNEKLKQCCYYIEKDLELYFSSFNVDADQLNDDFYKTADLKFGGSIAGRNHHSISFSYTDSSNVNNVFFVTQCRLENEIAFDINELVEKIKNSSPKVQASLLPNKCTINDILGNQILHEYFFHDGHFSCLIAGRWTMWFNAPVHN